MTIHHFPKSRIVRPPPRMLGVYEGGVCKLCSVRRGLVEIECLVDGEVTRMWVAAEHVRVFQEMENAMAGG